MSKLSELPTVSKLIGDKWKDTYPKLVEYRKMTKIGRVFFYCKRKNEEKKEKEEKEEKDKPTFKKWIMWKFHMKPGHASRFAAYWRDDANTVKKETAGVNWDRVVRGKIEYTKGVALMKKLLLWQLVTGDPKWGYCIFHLAQVLKYDYLKKHEMDTLFLMYSKQVDPYYTDRGVRWNYRLEDIEIMVSRMNRFVENGNWANGFCTLLD